MVGSSCRQYVLRSAALTFEFTGAAASGKTLSTRDGSLRVLAPDGAVASGEMTFTKREQFSSSWVDKGYYVDFAGTFTATVGSDRYVRGVFYSTEEN